jgi:hypothetical protein
MIIYTSVFLVYQGLSGSIAYLHEYSVTTSLWHIVVSIITSNDAQLVPTHWFLDPQVSIR